MTSRELYTSLSKELTHLLDRYNTEAKQLPIGEQFTYQLHMHTLMETLQKINRLRGHDESKS